MGREDSGPGSRYDEAHIGFTPNNETQGEIYRHYKGLDYGKSRCPSSMFIGGVGTGKTHMAAVIWNYIERELGRSGYKIPPREWWYVPSFFDQMREEMESSSLVSTCDRCKHCSLLVLDDLGAEKTTDWVSDTLNSVIDYRYREQRPTIITTNKSTEDCISRYGQALVSRITEMCSVYRFKGSDQRLKEE